MGKQISILTRVEYRGSSNGTILLANYKPLYFSILYLTLCKDNLQGANPSGGVTGKAFYGQVLQPGALFYKYCPMRRAHAEDHDEDQRQRL
jgi:hypothetical protein